MYMFYVILTLDKKFFEIKFLPMRAGGKSGENFLSTFHMCATYDSPVSSLGAGVLVLLVLASLPSGTRALSVGVSARICALSSSLV